MIKEVFIVTGESGEFSDRDVWGVVAYTERTQADLHAKAAGEWWKANPINEDFDVRRNPFDPTLRDYDMPQNPTYTVKAIPLFAHFDQFQEES